MSGDLQGLQWFVPCKRLHVPLPPGLCQGPSSGCNSFGRPLIIKITLFVKFRKGQYQKCLPNKSTVVIASQNITYSVKTTLYEKKRDFVITSKEDKYLL